MTTYRSRRAVLRLDVIDEKEELPDRLSQVPALLQSWGLHKEPQECVWVVAYDANMTIRNVIEVARGTHVRSEVHIPTVLAAVLTAGCERFLLVHNHPTTRLTPSKGDRRLTETIMYAANACGLFFEDHLILTPNGKWFSFAAKGLIVPADYAEYSEAGEDAADHFISQHGY